MEHYLLIGIGGSIGALLRYSFSKFVGERFQGEWPLATFLINLAGSFGLGVVSPVLLTSQTFTLFFGIGVLGAFTTFSTYIYETVLFMEQGQLRRGCSYLISSLVLGTLLYAFGFWLGKKVF